MTDLQSTTELVKDILTENPDSRDSDNFLFYLVCKKLLGDQGMDIETMGFTKLFLSLHGYGLPQFGTVGRVRRKLQQQFPELKCSYNVGVSRSMNEALFEEYAIED